LRQREQNLKKDRECFEKTTRIAELEKEFDKIKLERDRLAQICSELKAELNTLQNKLIRQGNFDAQNLLSQPSGSQSTDLLKYRDRILELENQIKDLTNQLEKWTGKPKGGIKYGSIYPVKELSRSPNKEEQKLQIEGVNYEQPGRPFSAFVPPVRNSERQTISQQKVAHHVKKEIVRKSSKPKARNYNLKDDSQ